MRWHARDAAALEGKRIPGGRWKGVGCVVLLTILVGQLHAAHREPTDDEKLMLIRGVVAEIGLARLPFPRGTKPIELNAPDGRILNLAYLQQETINRLPAVPLGGRVIITALKFRADKLILDVNGGLGDKKKWYEHIEVGLGNRTAPLTSAGQRAVGAQIVLRFPGGIPALTTAEIKRYLAPLIDWNLKKAAEIRASTLPAPLRSAIQEHHVLVGMDTDMVIAARGRADGKVRERDPQTGDDYEDWVYGKPPAATEFVRIEGDRVIQITDFSADGAKSVRTKPEVVFADAPSAPTPASAGAPAVPAQQSVPTLRRPGEVGSNPAPASAAPVYLPGGPPPDAAHPGAPPPR
ncbi:MAG: hypothetical protein ACYC6M_11480 [Terriglobales bacterium]